MKSRVKYAIYFFIFSVLVLFGISAHAELGTSANMLFLWHFDGSSTIADYARATHGAITALQALRPLETDIVKFGTGSYAMGLSGPNKLTTTFPIYMNGDWVINPHECTIDYWVYYPTNLPENFFGIGPGFFLRSTTTPSFDRDLRTQIVSGSLQLNPYFLSTTNQQISHSISYTTMTTYAPVGQWNHFAWTWSSVSNNSYYFLNGFCVSTITTGVAATTNAISDAQWQAIDTDIGDGENGLGWYVEGLQGNGDDHGMASARMDELRISDIDRYGGHNFTPPTAPYTTPDFISPSGTVTLRIGGAQQFTASGGTGTYTWSLSTSILGTLNQNTGTTVIFTAGATGGTVTITVNDGSSQASATIIVTPTSAPVAPDIDFKVISDKMIFLDDDLRKD